MQPTFSTTDYNFMFELFETNGWDIDDHRVFFNMDIERIEIYRADTLVACFNTTTSQWDEV